MGKKATISLEERKKTVSLVSYYRDFKGDLDKWRRSYFDLLSWKNTFEFTYAMDIHSTGDHEAYLWMILRNPAQKEAVIEMLEDLQYSNVISHDVTVGEVYCDDYEIEYLFEQ